MNNDKHSWLYDFLFVLVLLMAGVLRFGGYDWGEGYHQHPDELFLTGVLDNLRAHACEDPSIPVDACLPENKRWMTVGEYFDSAASTLNPYVRGFGFFVYGNLPMTVTRVLMEATGNDDLGASKFFARQMSATMDLLTIFLLYLIASRLYGRKVGLFAAAFSSLAVMQIQQSHFFTSDLFVNLFMFLALLFAVGIVEKRPDIGDWRLEVGGQGEDARHATRQLPITNYPIALLKHPLFLAAIGFGFALGMAMASKINAAAMAIVLPFAFFVRWLIHDRRRLITDHRSLITDYWSLIAIFLVTGGLATFVSFRIFQPYAFDGLMLDPQWVKGISEQRLQATGTADLPWNLQWARRSNFFSFQNLTVWGLGLPLGILAWAGFLLMGWRIVRGEYKHLLLWGWTAFYFTWQSLQFNATMRYQLPVYPLLCMMAAWFVFELPRLRKTTDDRPQTMVNRPLSIVASVLGSIVLILTAVWAFAFQSIYLRDEPRMAASRWMFQNVPAGVNVRIQTNENGSYNQPLPIPSGLLITAETPYAVTFTPQREGVFSEVTFGSVTDASSLPATVDLTVYSASQQDVGLAYASTVLDVPAVNFSESSLVLKLDQSLSLVSSQQYVLKIETTGSGVYLSGAFDVVIQTSGGAYHQSLSVPPGLFIAAGSPYLLTFTPEREGTLGEVTFGYTTDVSDLPAQLDLFVYSASQPDKALARGSIALDAAPAANSRGSSLTLHLDRPIPLAADQQYTLKIQTTGRGVYITGSAIANETDYDWGLPFRIDGYDPYGGLYSSEDLVLQVYWVEDANKLNRYVDILSKADYIVIPTNHQYGQITRVPERYPLTTLYYRELLGCPEGEDIIACYRAAEPGMYKGRLGFELEAVFTSYPTLGPIVINDQSAEEAFTFYDHPKVMIFKKTDDFDAESLRALFNSVDLTQVVQLPPREFDHFKNLMLPEARLASQRAGGTWSDLFDYDWIHNRYPVVGALVWYLFIFVLGVFAYPIVRLALPGLRQYAYALGRIGGLVLLAWLAWMGGSLGVPYTRVSIGAALALIAVTAAALWMRRREEFKADWNSNRRFFVMVEVVFLAFFIIDLLIRLGNADMWHPAKGGERPMDFSYFNAVLKSTSFPPYDPWFAGGYINYYYYGFVLAGTPVKLLGIVPSIAYNFILPTWLALVAMGAFAVGFALVEGRGSKVEGQLTDDRLATFDLRLMSGLAASFLTILLGNLGTIQLVFNAIQRIAAPGGVIPAETDLLQRWSWAFQGLWKMFTQGALLPVGRGDWYWFPSRVIPPGPGNEITEFPLFTFLYSDLHAHMLVMPLALFIIAWALSFVRSRAELTPGEWIASLGIGALFIGALKPTNTWDLYTYYLLAAIAAAYTIIRYFDWKGYFSLSPLAGKIGLAIGAAAALYVLGSLFYLPFSQWFGQAYNSAAFWQASRTSFSSYFTQWGLFLFILTAWLAWETREWMAVTPVSRVNGLRRYVLAIEIVLAAFIALLIFFLVEGVKVGFVALPLALWAAVLLLRADLPDTKRFILFLTGTALAITIAVELIALVGDIGRMNTIFKLYLQAWMMFAVSAAAAFGWLLPVFPLWRTRWRAIYQGGVYMLMAGAFLFTLTASTDKISDRINPEAPRTLDGMDFMNHSELWDGQVMDLSQDYRAIRWMQDNIEGSPVIVEANCTEYRWCTRFTIYTGLPGVVGWNWHQRQQRGVFAPQVQRRVDEVGAFYTTTDIQAALAFLRKYDVKYIVVGQLERNIYPVLEGMPDGLSKFPEFEGQYWRAVYQDGATTIYEVVE
ncbi:MAG: hypothetical protein DPW18_19730 [Chloroflexi bacterium]|nr:hypothetical protein [Chloroflexota bacterium]MDL1942208.1 hypothetical protein [Chloroflexi bacterium CFX2]